MPTFTIPTILAAATTSTTTASKKSGGSSEIFLVILVVFVGVYFLFLRPRQQKAKAARAGAGKTTLAVGDEVVTIGGILGTVSAVEGDAVIVEVAPGTHLSFLLRAVNLRTAVAGAPRANPVADDAGNGEYETYDDEDESWEDEDAAGDDSFDHPAGSGSTALDDGAPHEVAGDAGDGPDSDRGGRGEGRRR
jgi:preprotein translocase subunit YajC